MPLAIDAQVGLLDELLSRLTHRPESLESEIAHEHFQEGRLYLLGAMYGEYAFSLGLGRRAIHAMHDRNTRSKLNHVFSLLIDANRHSRFYPAVQIVRVALRVGGRVSRRLALAFEPV